MRQNALWNYFYELAQARKVGAIFDRLSLPGEDVYGASKRKSRLSLLPGFPGDLADCICAAGRGTQELKVEPGQIYFIERIDGDSSYSASAAPVELLAAVTQSSFARRRSFQGFPFCEARAKSEFLHFRPRVHIRGHFYWHSAITRGRVDRRRIQ
jgi:hypothetical protein